MLVVKEIFNIYIDRLKGGKRAEIVESVAPVFMEIAESDLAFNSPIALKGEAFVSDGTLFLELEIETVALMMCSICNCQFAFKVHIPKLYHAESVDEIKGAIFNFREIVREQILLEIPPVVECQNGSCPERQSMAKFMKKNAAEDFHPFAEL